MSDIAAKLDEARALIEKGWCQGDFEREGCYCLYGAIQKVVTGDASCSWSILTEPLEKALADVIGYHSGLMDAWNDAEGRTQAEVIEAFRKAAELARAEAQ